MTDAGNIISPDQHLLTWRDKSDKDWHRMVQQSVAVYRGEWQPSQLPGRSVGMVYFNPSLRTRTSMEAAAARLNLHPVTIVPGQGTWAFEWEDGVVMDGERSEHVREGIGVLSRYFDVLGVRAFSSGTDYAADRDEVLFRKILDAATVPVISLESAFYHPCQALADAATLHLHFGGATRGKRFVLAWAYHPKALPVAVPNSALLMAARMGMEVTVARPEGFELDAGIMAQARKYAATHNQSVTETANLHAAASGADIIYAKAWGGRRRYDNPSGETALRMHHKGWRITQEVMERTNSGAFMHCLPVRRNLVVDDAVIDGPQAIHLLQSEFRLHAQVAILAQTLGL